MRRFIGVVVTLLITFGAFGQTDSGTSPGQAPGTNPAQVPATSPAQAVIESKLGKDSNKSTNKDSTFTLYKAVKDNSSGVPVLHYIVLRNGDKKIVLEGSKTMGVIEWSAAYELEEGRTLGSGQGEISDKRKIDLRSYLLGRP